MLTRLAIKNFRSIGTGPNDTPGIDIELRPLTLFVGPNGAGKSSILEAVALASQKGSHNGPLVSYSTVNETIHRKDLALTGTIEFAISPSLGNSKEFAAASVRLIFSKYKTDLAYIVEGVATNEETTIKRELGEWFFDKVYFLRGMRGVQAGPVAPANAEWVGPHGENIIHILNLLNSPEHHSIRDKVQRWGECFDIKNLSGYTIGTQLDSGYKEAILDVYLSLRSTSYGSSQVLPIIVQLFWSEPHRIIMIEEPEISLHPKAQVDMAHLLAEVAQGGKQIIATTHSTFLLMGIGRAVRDPDIALSPDDVAIYEIEKGESGSTAKRLFLDTQGNVQGWAESSFGRIERELLREWSMSLPEV